MKNEVLSSLKRLVANAATPQDLSIILASGVPMAALQNVEVQTVMRKAATGAMLSEPELRALIVNGINTETFLGIKPKAHAPNAPFTLPMLPDVPATLPATGPAPVVSVSTDPIERLDKRSRASFIAKARTRAIYALRDGLKARGAPISDEQHTDAAGFARTETSLTGSVLATLSKNGRQVNRTVGTEDALKAYRNALADAGIVVSDDAYAVAQAEALASYEAFLAATRRIVVRALAL